MRTSLIPPRWERRPPHTETLISAQRNALPASGREGFFVFRSAHRSVRGGDFQTGHQGTQHFGRTGQEHHPVADPAGQGGVGQAAT